MTTKYGFGYNPTDETFTSYEVDVLGKLWQPGFTAAMSYTTHYAPEDATDRNAWAERADVLARDFSEVTDFRVTEVVRYLDGGSNQYSRILDWADEASDYAFFECMYPEWVEED